MTCSATNTAIVARGGRIIWADIDSETGLIDPLDVARKIEDDTVAIMGVDWGGQSCDWHSLSLTAARYGVRLIEDAAHALGAFYGHRRVGSGYVDFTAFSLQAIKSITSVDGGILASKRTSDNKRGKLLRWYGIDRDTPRKDMRCEEDLLEAGWKWHMNDVNATIGIVQLEYLEGIVALQRRNARFYYENLKGPKPAFPQSNLLDSSFWLYTLLCTDKEQRLRFQEYMKEKNVMVSQVHARCDTHTCFAPFKKHPLPGVDSFTDRQVSIPVHWALTEKERDYVCETVNSFFAKETSHAAVEA
jgi:dTDP-4-amino-4,6-dideoxygalactose transaminase